MRGNRDAAPNGDGQVWALRDLSFEVEPGEVLGIVGRNGAGKSTLLKVLSRITEPTTGRVELYGRVGSLLEVGTGFHPELTGRENIFLSGAILGMRRAEIVRKFDEMVAFAEVEKFIDTPVKHFSSGMYVRLAFAVAAHLEPEILLVDEVLAVGDAAFQKKCMGKMGDVARAGRTIIFVSHNMASIESLCNSCLLISSGRLEARGEPVQIVMRYMAPELGGDGGIRSLVDHHGRRGDSIPIMTSITLHSGADEPMGSMRMGSLFSARVEFNAAQRIR
ncbi:MAG TPA: ABC transporter ATP-binding protein, partial [Steroidobacteraceae bacterium]|nr:ABC transporter ATP-binding protein [Steroidobacteraceae bacterium]